MFSFTFERQRGVLRADLTGRWSADVVDQYLKALLSHAESAREETGRLRLLVHAEDSELEPGALARMKVLERNVLRSPGDRIAIVLRSSMGKRDLKSISVTEQVASFLSPHAANMWLLAYG